MNNDHIGCIRINTHSEVPEPIPWKKFMVWIGPVMMTVALGLGTSEVILYPNLTARFGVGWLGLMVFVLFLFMAWILFFNTQLTTAEALVRQNTDITWRISASVRRLFKDNIKHAYFLWWIIYIVISFVLIGLQYSVKGANPFSYVTFAAMLSFVSLVFSLAATFIGSMILYRHETIRKVKPLFVWVILLGLGLVVHLYIIVRAAGYFIGFWK